jgi:hypothetical protein
MNRYPANELLEDLALERMHGEGQWNPLEQDPIAAHRLDRMGQMIPVPDQDVTPQPSSAGASLGKAMGAYWWWVLGIALGAWLGASAAGWIGAILGACLGGWIAGRAFEWLSKRKAEGA